MRTLEGNWRTSLQNTQPITFTEPFIHMSFSSAPMGWEDLMREQDYVAFLIIGMIELSYRPDYFHGTEHFQRRALEYLNNRARISASCPSSIPYSIGCSDIIIREGGDNPSSVRLGIDFQLQNVHMAHIIIKPDTFRIIIETTQTISDMITAQVQRFPRRYHCDFGPWNIDIRTRNTNLIQSEIRIHTGNNL